MRFFSVVFHGKFSEVLTDITEFHIPAGKVYLSSLIDCFDVGATSWSIGTSPDADLVNRMLDNAISTLKDDKRPIVHSDRGCYYRWPGWIDRMNNAGLQIAQLFVRTSRCSVRPLYSPPTGKTVYGCRIIKFEIFFIAYLLKSKSQCFKNSFAIKVEPI